MDSNVSTVGTERNVGFETPPISKIQLGRYPFPARKFSFPAALHASLLGLSKDNGKEVPSGARRRFSNVGDVVSRKLSYTIGWKTQSNPPPQEVILQGKMLCGQYIKSRLKRSGIFNKKLCLYRIRSVIGTSSSAVVREVAPYLLAVGNELERMHPKLYNRISRKTSATPGGALVSDKNAAGLLAAIAHELLKSKITWGKVASVFAVAGGLAVDCVCQGHPEYLHGLLESMTEVLEDDLAEWVASNGGWTTLIDQCRCPEDDFSFLDYASKAAVVVGILMALLLVSYFLIRFFEKAGYF